MITARWLGTLIKMSKILPEGKKREFTVVILKEFKSRG